MIYFVVIPALLEETININYETNLEIFTTKNRRMN